MLMRQRTYCLDTGPLFDHFVLSFFEKRNEAVPHGLARKLRYLGSNPYLQARYRELLRRSKALVTHSGVLLEVDWWFENYVGDKKLVPVFKEFLQTQIELLKIEEILVSWGQLDVEELKEFGPVDSALIALLRVKQERELKLVTGDSRLRNWCLQRRLHCLEVHELLKKDAG